MQKCRNHLLIFLANCGQSGFVFSAFHWCCITRNQIFINMWHEINTLKYPEPYAILKLTFWQTSKLLYVFFVFFSKCRMLLIRGINLLSSTGHLTLGKPKTFPHRNQYGYKLSVISWKNRSTNCIWGKKLGMYCMCWSYLHFTSTPFRWLNTLFRCHFMLLVYIDNEWKPHIWQMQETCTIMVRVISKS